MGIQINDNLADAAGVGTLLTIGIGDKEYHLSRIKLGHLALVQQFAVKYYREQALDALRASKDVLPPEELTKLVQGVMSEATITCPNCSAELIVHHGNWMRLLFEPIGVQHLVYLLLKDNHPDISENDALLILPVEYLDLLLDKIREITGGQQEGEASPPVQAPSEPTGSE